MGYDDRVDFEVLQGLTLERILHEAARSGGNENEALYFVTSGGTFRMRHEQDCCEGVNIEDTIGDPRDLWGAHLTAVDEAISPYTEASESGTWTFYKISTPKGDLTIRWLGESNGYYSESVDLERYTEPIPPTAVPWEPKA